MAMNDFENLFQAMSDGTRQRILLLLQERARCVGALVEEFHLSQPTISKHLTILKNAGLVKDERQGQQVVYSLNCEGLRSCCADYFKRFSCCHSLFDKLPEEISD